jgi:hypothetical protein
VPLKPTFEVTMADGKRTSAPAYLPSGGTISILSGDPQTGRALLALPGRSAAKESETLAVEVSTKPFINLVWLGCRRDAGERVPVHAAAGDRPAAGAGEGRPEGLVDCHAAPVRGRRCALGRMGLPHCPSVQ